MKKKSIAKEWTKAILLALLTILIGRGFFFDAYTIPSASMEKSLMTGDYVIVSKISCGSRFPNTPLSIPFVQAKLTENTNSFLNWIKIPYFRLFGGPYVKRNEILVFNYPLEQEYPVDERTFYIKRCVAIAGDTLEIKRGEVFINNKYNDVPDNLQFNYKVLCDKDTIATDTLLKSGITEGGKMRNKGEYWFNLNLENVEKLKEIAHITSIEPLLENETLYNENMFPGNENYNWNVDYYGPIYIPKAGDSVQLTLTSLPLYERIIGVYENNDLRVRNDSIIINNKYCTSYKFKMNYFFMLGDNRHNSTDSRFWGFVPEDHIVGKAVMVLMSIDKSKEKSHIRSERWFKGIK